MGTVPEPVSRSFQKARKSTKKKDKKKKVKKQSRKRRKSRKSKTRKSSSRGRGPPSKGGSSSANVYLNFGDSIPRNSSEHVVANDPKEAGGDDGGGGGDDGGGGGGGDGGGGDDDSGELEVDGFVPFSEQLREGGRDAEDLRTENDNSMGLGLGLEDLRTENDNSMGLGLELEDLRTENDNSPIHGFFPSFTGSVSPSSSMSSFRSGSVSPSSSMSSFRSGSSSRGEEAVAPYSVNSSRGEEEKQNENFNTPQRPIRNVHFETNLNYVGAPRIAGSVRTPPDPNKVKAQEFANRVKARTFAKVNALFPQGSSDIHNHNIIDTPQKADPPRYNDKGKEIAGNFYGGKRKSDRLNADDVNEFITSDDFNEFLNTNNTDDAHLHDSVNFRTPPAAPDGLISADI
jgi:hypothetical protein